MSDLTDATARDLARRWADWRTWATRQQSLGHLDAEYEGPWDPHGEAGSERERLESWVRARMAALLAEHPHMVGTEYVRGWLLCHLWGDLGLVLVDAADLCEAAGWPS